MLKGLHGLHVYATEYWTEYVLLYAASVGNVDAKSPLIILANQLAMHLNHEAVTTVFNEVDVRPKMSDERLAHLRAQMSVYRLVEKTLNARSVKQLESDLLGTGKSTFEQMPEQGR